MSAHTRHTALLVLSLSLLLIGAAVGRHAGFALEPIAASLGATWLPRAVVPTARHFGVFDPARNRIYAAEFQGDIVIIDTESGEILDSVPIIVATLALSPAGDRLYAISHSLIESSVAWIRFIDLDAPDDLTTFTYACSPEALACYPHRFTFGPEGRLYVVNPGGQFVDVLDPDTGQVINSLHVDVAGDAEIVIVDNILYVPGGPYLTLYDISGQYPSHLTNFTFPGWITDIAASPDGAFLAIVAGNGLYRLDVGSSAPTRINDAVTSVHLWLAPDGTLVTNNEDGIFAFDPLTGETVRSLSSAIYSTPIFSPLPIQNGGIATFELENTRLFGPADYAAALPIITGEE
jgi:DNA-binding beta-propeller fold protein YncE